MTWTQDTDSGVLDHAGTDRTSWTSDDPHPSSFSLLTQFAKPADAIRTWVFGTQDARSCWEAGVLGANVIIREVSFASAAAASATAAHGLTAGVPYLQETRVVNGLISVYLNGSATAAVEFQVPDDDDKRAFNAFGIVSVIDLARCLSFLRAELIPAVLVRNKILATIGAGRLFASIGGESLREIARGVSRETGYVSMTEYKSKVYIADGQKWKVFDPTPITVADWVATAGTLPKFFQTVVHFGRIVGFTIDDPQNLYALALNDALDADTAADAPGRAYTLPLARAGVSGQVIRCLSVGAQNELVLGAGSSAWRLLGDPSRGAINLSPLSQTVGVSGPSSMFQADEGFVLLHSPAGLHRAIGSLMLPINDLVLTKGITFNPEDRDHMTVSVVRDPRRKIVFIFMDDDRLDPEECEHFAYSERVGGFERDTGGMYSFRLPFRVTAATVWDSEVLMGCGDGFIRQWIPDDEAASDDDDDGTAIESFAPWQQINEPGDENDTILTRLTAVLAQWSGSVTARIWRGQTSEQAYDENSRSLAIERALAWVEENGLKYAPGAITQPTRAPALVCEMYAASGRWGIETVSVTTEVAQVTTRHAWPVKPAPGALCAFPGAGSTGSTGGGSTGLGTGPGWSGTGPGSGTGSMHGTGSGSGATGWNDQEVAEV